MKDYLEADRHRVGQLIDGRCFLGFVLVDSARILISDPLVAARAAEVALERWDKENEDTQIDEMVGNETPANPPATGVVAETEIGDGLYPAFAYVNEDGRPYRVVIELGSEWSALGYGKRPNVMEAMPPREEGEE